MSGASTVVGLFSKLFDPDRIDMTPEAAECLLRVAFDQADRDRVHVLVQKNSRGELTPEEDQELESYILAGDLLTILHLKARAALKDMQTTAV
jgi:hypothetical protein